MGPKRRRHTGRVTRYSAQVAEAICGRLEAGQSLRQVCRDVSLPCYRTVMNWREKVPEFRARYVAARARQAEVARALGRRSARPVGTSRYHPALGEAICVRIASGESLHAICREPAMPCYSTVMLWAERHPEFAAAYRRARTYQAHALVDEVADIARSDLSPADKQARARALSWVAGRLAPKQYGEKAEPEGAEDERALIQVVVNKAGRGAGGGGSEFRDGGET